MVSRTLSPQAQKTMEEYFHLPLPNKNISCPYYNNKRSNIRGGLRVLVGKGSAKDIREEIELVCVKNKEDIRNMTDDQIKKRLIESKIGIDCSGLAYYILNAESISKNCGPLRKYLKFPCAKNMLRRLISRMRPIENTDVLSFAHEKNSREVELKNVKPGDYIVLLSTGPEKTYNHILTIYQTDFLGDTLKKIYYVHSFAWPSDGKYAHGVRKGSIEIIDPTKPAKDQLWLEEEKTGEENFTQEKAREAKRVSIRRLKWL